MTPAQQVNQYEADLPFNAVTSLNFWGRAVRILNRLFRGVCNMIGSQAKKGQIKLTLASLRRDLHTHYMHIGEVIFRLSEGEEHPSPLDEKEIRTYFRKVRRTLRAITQQKQKYESLRRKPWIGWVMGKRD